MRKVLLVSVLVLLALLMIAPLSAQAADCGTHVVQRGENLFRIGLRYGVHYRTLAAYNGIYDPARIYAGQVIRIPCTGTVVTSNPVVTTYPVTAYPVATTTNPWVTTTTTTTQTTALQCAGFRATSPDAFPNGSITFYWDPPTTAQNIARYQVRIMNAVGRQVAAYEALAPSTSLLVDVSLNAIGPGINFSYYVVGVTADNQICQTATRRVQREWTNTMDPTS